MRISAYTPATHDHEIARTMGVCTRIELAGRICHRLAKSCEGRANAPKTPAGRCVRASKRLQGFCRALRENAYKAATSAGPSSYTAATSGGAA